MKPLFATAVDTAAMNTNNFKAIQWNKLLITVAELINDHLTGYFDFLVLIEEVAY